MRCKACGKELRKDNTCGYCVFHYKEAIKKPRRYLHCAECGKPISTKRHHSTKYCCKYCQQKSWTVNHRESNRKYNKKYRDNNKVKVAAIERKWCQNNKEKIRAKSRRFYKKNKAAVNFRAAERYRNNNLTRLRQVMRSRIRGSLKRYRQGSQQYKKSKASSLLLIGCSMPELEKHLESQFQPGMTWENWSFKGWHVDHILPLDSFDLSKEEEKAKAYHYTNLQPLWAEENLKKSNKIL